MCHNVSDAGTLSLLAQGGLPLPCEVFGVQASSHPPSRGGNRSLEGRVASGGDTAWGGGTFPSASVPFPAEFDS